MYLLFNLSFPYLFFYLFLFVSSSYYCHMFYLFQFILYFFLCFHFCSFLFCSYSACIPSYCNVIHKDGHTYFYTAIFTFSPISFIFALDAQHIMVRMFPCLTISFFIYFLCLHIAYF